MSLEAVGNRVSGLKNTRLTVGQRCAELLHSFGIHKCLGGYDAIIAAIYVLEENPDFLQNINNKLYPAILQRMAKDQIPHGNLQRVIGYAIKIGTNRSTPSWTELFGDDKPSISIFLSSVYTAIHFYKL